MRGMRTPGSEFETENLRTLAAASAPTALARLQQGFFEKRSDKNTPTEVKEFTMDGDTYYIKPIDSTHVYMSWSNDFTKPQSALHVAQLPNKQLSDAVYQWLGTGDDQFSGKDFKRNAAKMATIYDGYGYRLTIETKAGQTNESYTSVLAVLAEADIRYREVRRYTIDPDRVCVDILVRQEDLELLQDLAKEVEADGILITFNDNISEAIKPKQIVTPQDEVTQNMPKSKTAGKQVTALVSEWVPEAADLMVNTRTHFKIEEDDDAPWNSRFQIKNDEEGLIGHANTLDGAMSLADGLAPVKKSGKLTKKQAANTERMIDDIFDGHGDLFAMMEDETGLLLGDYVLFHHTKFEDDPEAFFVTDLDGVELESFSTADDMREWLKEQLLGTYANKKTTSAKPISIFDLIADWEGQGYGLALVDAKTDKVIEPYVDGSDYPDVMFKDSRDGAKSTDGKYYIKFHSGILEEDPDYLTDKQGSKKALAKAANSDWLEEDDGTLLNSRTNYRIDPLPEGFADKFDIEDAASEVVGHAATLEEAMSKADKLAAGKNAAKKKRAADEYEDDPEIEDDLLEEPVDGDYMISDSGSLGSKTSVSEVGGRFLGEFNSMDDAEDFILARMESQQFWPGVWHMSDHGNIAPHSLESK